MINDVLDETGKILSFQKFQDTYNIQTNFFTYHGVITPEFNSCVISIFSEDNNNFVILRFFFYNYSNPA
jgi:hypothetical protein